jgi:hypothetical protein
MDIRKIRIYAPTFTATTLFICQFTDPKKDNKLQSLINDGKDGRWHEGELLPGMELKTMPLDRNFKYDFTFDYDQKNDKLYKNYENFWTRDPRVFCKSGKKNVNHELTNLILEDLTAEQDQKIVNIKDVRKALAKYETLSERTHINVAYYLGVVNADKLGKDPDALYILLADPTGGIIMKPENIQKFLNYQPDDEQVQLQINVRRAIEKGLVEKKNQMGKDTYFINNHPIGDTPESVIAYLDINKDFYFQFIVEKLGDIAEVTKQEAKSNKKEEIIETPDVEELRKLCKAKFEELRNLGIKGSKASRHAQFVSPQTMVKDLQDAIKEADKFIEEKKSKELLV